MRWWPRGAAILCGLVAALLVPAIAFAHPLGNFTINHYAGIRVEPDRILLDVVIDEAEIPTFQARLRLDTDGDGELSDAETEAGRIAACTDLATSLTLTVGGKAILLTAIEAGLAFPAGVGGLSTMRTVCGFQAMLSEPLAAATPIAYEDRAFPNRLGWREIVVSGSGVTLAPVGDATLRTEGVSHRLTAYPTNLLTQALADTKVEVAASPGGPSLPPLDIPDAAPLPGQGDIAVPSREPAPAAPTGVSAPAAANVVTGTVPGGVTSGDLPSIFRTADVTPVVLLVSLLTAAALGAGHALTPGHGKTLMAAYLVGTRGTPLHAAGLGLSVTLSHTVGILILAALVVGAQGLLPPDLVVKAAPVVAAISILAIGGWMLFAEGRRRRRARAAAAEHRHAHEHDVAHDHEDTHDHEDGPSAMPGEHSHGGDAHSHLPPPGSTITWRSLFVLGLAGGLIPSTSALLILLGSIAAGRPAFGFVLVVAFGIGMALVMGGIGLALVLARGRLDRVDATSQLGRFGSFVPLLASCLVVALGVYLTVQAMAGTTTY